MLCLFFIPPLDKGSNPLLLMCIAAVFFLLCFAECWLLVPLVLFELLIAVIRPVALLACRDQVHRLLRHSPPGLVDRQRARMVQGCRVELVGLRRASPHIRPILRAFEEKLCPIVLGSSSDAIEVLYFVHYDVTSGMRTHVHDNC